MNINRRKTRTAVIGGIKVGSGAPVTIQSMTKVRTADVNATVEQVKRLEKAGCEIIRVAVLDEDDARAITGITRRISIPLEADIHFSPALAMACVKAGADGIRLNPGNVRRKEDVKAIALAAKKRRISIRVGANSGSIIQGRRRVNEDEMLDSMVKDTLAYCRFIDSVGFHNLMVSLKASDVPTTIAAYRKFAKRTDYPLHLGITAAGPANLSAIRSSIGIGSLLADGIGDTIRVSVTGAPEVEVAIGREILATLRLRNFGPELLSCPTCGRCKVDIIGITAEVQKRLANFKSNVKIAIMGCPVNGPGEARDADIGIAAGKDQAVLFKNGKVVKTNIPISSAVAEIVGFLRKN